MRTRVPVGPQVIDFHHFFGRLTFCVARGIVCLPGSCLSWRGTWTAESEWKSRKKTLNDENQIESQDFRVTKSWSLNKLLGKDLCKSKNAKRIKCNRIWNYWDKYMLKSWIADLSGTYSKKVSLTISWKFFSSSSWHRAFWHFGKFPCAWFLQTVMAVIGGTFSQLSSIVCLKL